MDQGPEHWCFCGWSRNSINTFFCLFAYLLLILSRSWWQVRHRYRYNNKVLNSKCLTWVSSSNFHTNPIKCYCQCRKEAKNLPKVSHRCCDTRICTKQSDFLTSFLIWFEMILFKCFLAKKDMNKEHQEVGDYLALKLVMRCRHHWELQWLLAI